MQLSKKQEAELLTVYESWWCSYLTGDVKTYDSLLADDYHFVGSTNGEEYLNPLSPKPSGSASSP